jgi:hypothetical protein
MRGGTRPSLGARTVGWMLPYVVRVISVVGCRYDRYSVPPLKITRGRAAILNSRLGPDLAFFRS